ncbi:MAG: hypothetical protein KME01_03440 [Chroococcus sp. CMT-3BRIN-NPC107]|jgi:hypothetical protein|nr:hypothetical protein [Chroococcus sp. CMT-3BRIN-NPC107]
MQALIHLISPTLSPKVLSIIPAGKSILLKNTTWQTFAALLVAISKPNKGILEIIAFLLEHEYYIDSSPDLGLEVNIAHTSQN